MQVSRFSKNKSINYLKCADLVNIIGNHSAKNTIKIKGQQIISTTSLILITFFII